eukprot:GFYU01032919.1.p1 GENE.GFYU01032919.1~~GFYU01032919.1.p1  ORF type:complete len:458 (+),score=57.76 GFYU01032919.1:190-1374(+)
MPDAATFARLKSYMDAEKKIWHANMSLQELMQRGKIFVSLADATGAETAHCLNAAASAMQKWAVGRSPLLRAYESYILAFEAHMEEERELDEIKDSAIRAKSQQQDFAETLQKIEDRSDLDRKKEALQTKIQDCMQKRKDAIDSLGTRESTLIHNRIESLLTGTESLCHAYLGMQSGQTLPDKTQDSTPGHANVKPSSTTSTQTSASLGKTNSTEPVKVLSEPIPLSSLRDALGEESDAKAEPEQKNQLPEGLPKFDVNNIPLLNGSKPALNVGADGAGDATNTEDTAQPLKEGSGEHAISNGDVETKEIDGDGVDSGEPYAVAESQSPKQLEKESEEMVEQSNGPNGVGAAGSANVEPEVENNAGVMPLSGGATGEIGSTMSFSVMKEALKVE